MSTKSSRFSISSLLFPLPVSGGASRLALQRLIILRAIVTTVSTLGYTAFQFSTPIEVSNTLIIGLVFTIALSCILGWWRLKKAWPVSPAELFGHLLIDGVFLIVLLVFTGGVSNPLISYLLVLLAVGATLLPRFFISTFALLSVIIYTLFLLSDIAQGQDHTAEMMDFQLHLVGMWVIFLVSAVLITVFVTRMARAIQDRELNLAQARESEIRNEQLVAIGTLAAGTAHALGTPLSTMSVLLTDLDKLTEQELQQQLTNKDLQADIALLKQQVYRCKDSISELVKFYHKENSDVITDISVSKFRDEVAGYITNIHPRAEVIYEIVADSSRGISSEPAFKHAVINILENAIKACKKRVSVKFDLSSLDLTEIRIQDDGPGIPTSVMENMGEPFVSTRKESMGLGIFLANASIQKLGGSIELFNHRDGGALALIKLPHRVKESEKS